MPRRLALATLAGLAGLAATAGARALTLTAERPALPELAFRDPAGNVATLAGLRGRVVVLNVWATWCAPCRDEMPSLDRLQGLFDPARVLVLALSVDRGDDAKPRAFLAEIGATRLGLWRDPAAKAPRTLKLPGLPATIVVDRAGRQAARHLGIEQWDRPEIVALLEHLAAEPG
jgi:thiol-disulfide isomerase/thioredoxin